MDPNRNDLVDSGQITNSQIQYNQQPITNLPLTANNGGQQLQNQILQLQHSSSYQDPLKLMQQLKQKQAIHQQQVPQPVRIISPVQFQNQLASDQSAGRLRAFAQVPQNVNIQMIGEHNANSLKQITQRPIQLNPATQNFKKQLVLNGSRSIQLVLGRQGDPQEFPIPTNRQKLPIVGPNLPANGPTAPLLTPTAPPKLQLITNLNQRGDTSAYLPQLLLKKPVQPIKSKSLVLDANFQGGESRYIGDNSDASSRIEGRPSEKAEEEQEMADEQQMGGRDHGQIREAPVVVKEDLSALGGSELKDDLNRGDDKRRQWLPEEDLLINVFVDKFGTKKWNIIAEQLKKRIPGSCRNGKQCRERWHNNLDHKIKKCGWNPNEEYVFMEAHKIHGNKWAEIANYIPGRTDNQIKNHFYSSLRKLISKLKKFEIPEKIFQDKQALIQTDYLVNYLYQIGLNNNTGENVDDAIKDGSNKRRNSRAGDGGSPNGILSQSLLAQFDVYLIKKLKENGVSMLTIKQYRKKLKQINKALESMENKQKLAATERAEAEDCSALNETNSNINLGKRSFDRSMMERQQLGTTDYSGLRKQRVTQMCDRDEMQSSNWNTNSNLASIKKPYPTLPTGGALFKVEKDPARLIEKEINLLMTTQIKSSTMITDPFSSLMHSQEEEHQLLHARLMEDHQKSHSRMNQIIKKKIQLDQDHLANIQRNEQSQIILDLLKKVNVDDKMFDDGILEQYIKMSRQNTAHLEAKQKLKEKIMAKVSFANSSKSNSPAAQRIEDAKRRNLQKKEKDHEDSAHLVGQQLKDIPSRNQSVTIQAESLLLKQSEVLSSESLSLSSCIHPNPDVSDGQVDPRQLKKMSKMTNKFNSEKSRYEGEKDFTAFRPQSYNSQEPGARSRLGEDAHRRHSHKSINLRRQMLKAGHIISKQKDKSKQQQIVKPVYSIQSSINRIQKTSVKPELAKKDVNNEQRQRQQYLLNRRKSNSQHAAYKFSFFQKSLLNIAEQKMRDEERDKQKGDQIDKVDSRKEDHKAPPSQSNATHNMVQIECSNYYNYNNPFTAHSLYSAEIGGPKTPENNQHQLAVNPVEAQKKQVEFFESSKITSVDNKKLVKTSEAGYAEPSKTAMNAVQIKKQKHPQESGPVFGQYNLNRTYNFKDQQDVAIQQQNQRTNSPPTFLPVRAQLPNFIDGNKRLQLLRPSQMPPRHLRDSHQTARDESGRHLDEELHFEDPAPTMGKKKATRNQLQGLVREPNSESEHGFQLPLSVVKNTEKSAQMNNRLKLPLNETSYRLTHTEIEKPPEKQKKTDIFKELMSAYNLKNLNEEQSAHHAAQNIIRQEYPSEYTKSNVHTNLGQQELEQPPSVRSNKRIMTQTMGGKTVQRQGSCKTTRPCMNAYHGDQTLNLDLQMPKLLDGAKATEQPTDGQFDKLFKKLFKAQQNLISTINFHKKQVKMLEDNVQKLIEVRSALEKKDKDTMNQLILDFKAQHAQVSNSIGQSELYHVKIQQQLLKLKQLHLEKNIQVQLCSSNGLDNDPALDSPKEQIESYKKLLTSAKFLTGDTGGNQIEKKSQSDIKSRSNNKLPSISDVIENFTKSKQDEEMKGQEPYDKQTLFHFLNKSNHSPRGNEPHRQKSSEIVLQAGDDLRSPYSRSQHHLDHNQSSSSADWPDKQKGKLQQHQGTHHLARSSTLHKRNGVSTFANDQRIQTLSDVTDSLYRGAADYQR